MPTLPPIISQVKWDQVHAILDHAWMKGIIAQYRRSSHNSFYFKMRHHSHHIRLSDHTNNFASNGKINWVFENEKSAIELLINRYDLPDVTTT